MDAISFTAEPTNWDDTSETFVTYSRLMSIGGGSDVNVDLSQFSNISSAELLKRCEDTFTSLSSSVSDVCVSPLDMLQSIYERNVIRKLQMAAEYVRRIYPLSFRVEVLENLFSLLFVSHQDVDDSSEPSDSGEQGSEDGTQETIARIPTPTTPISPSTGSIGAEFKCYPSEAKRRSLFAEIHPKCLQSKTTSDVAGGFEQPQQRASQIRTSSVTQDKQRERESSSTSEVKPGKTGSCSVNSGTSSSGSKHIGFLAHEYIVRDLLVTLRDALVDLSACRYSILGQDSVHESDQSDGDARRLQYMLEGSVATSVESTQLTQRISRLTQYVSESLWRFQLVSPVWMTQQFGKIDDEWRWTGEDGSSDEDEGG